MIQKTKLLIRTGFFYIFGGSVLSKVIAFLSSIILVRILTRGEYGIFTYAWNIYNFVIIFNGLGMESSTMQLCSERSGDVSYANKICNYAVKFGLRFDITLAVILVLVALFVPLKINGANEILILLSLLPLIQLLFGICNSYIRSQKQNREYGILSVVCSASIMGFSVLGAILFREKGMVLGYYAAYTISFLVAWVVFKIHFKTDGRDHLEKKDKKSLISIGIISTCNNGLSQLLYLLDIFVLGIVLADEIVLAGYKVATTIPFALVFIPSSINIYVYPYFAQHKDDKEWFKNRYKQLLGGVAALNGIISVALVFFAPFIIGILFGNQYLDIIPIFRILSLNYFISGTFRIISGNLLVTLRKLRFNLYNGIICGILNIILDFLLIQLLGPMGAAIATVSVVVVSSVLSTLYLMYVLR